MIEVRVQHAFPGFTLDVAFTASAGITVIFGPSGAGKSLTLRAIAGLFRPQRGRIAVNGEVWVDTERGIWVRPQDRKVGYVPQHYGLFPHMTVRENIAFGIRRWPTSRREERVRELLALMQLDALADRRPTQLSGGQQQRVALARALAPNPRLLLLDEALGALDPVLRAQLQETVRLVQRTYGVPVLMITHDVNEVAALADTVVVMQEGRVVQTGSVEEVFHHPATPDVARGVGMTNIFTGTVCRHTLEATKVSWAGHELLVPKVPAATGTQITFGIRPEEVVFVREGRPLRFTHNVVPTTVLEHRRGAGHSHLVLALVNRPDVVLHAVLPRPLALDLGLRPGQRCRVLLRVRALHVFPENA